MYSKPEFPPLLPPGLHVMSWADLEELCVTRFPLSTTRAEIMAGLRQVLARILPTKLPGQVWINGSFVTESINPADVDIVVMGRADSYDAGPAGHKAVIEWLESKVPKAQFRCDTFIELLPAPDSPFAYLGEGAITHWKRIFGHGPNSGDPKGIAVLELAGLRL